MAFKRPIAAVRSVIPQNFGAPHNKDFMADIYAYLSSSANWVTSLPNDAEERVVLSAQAENTGAGYSVDDILTMGTGSLSSSQGHLNYTDQPTDGETVTLDGKIYTFQSVLTDVDGYVLIGGVASVTYSNLRDAVNLGATAGVDYALSTTLHPTVFAEITAATFDVTAKTSGAGEDSITLTETVSNGSWSAPTLTNGGTRATLRVTSVGLAGEVTCVRLRSRGGYTPIIPSGSTAFTGGGGSGASVFVVSGTSPGSFSFLADAAVTPPGLDPFQINFLNAGTAETPDTSRSHIGINARALADGITDSTNPDDNGGGVGSVGSFSGDGIDPINGHGPLAMNPNVSNVSDRYLILDFDDALLVAFYSTQETYTPRAFHTGLIFKNRWASDLSGGNPHTDIQITGLGTLGGDPADTNSLSTEANWFNYSATATQCAVRLSLGRSIGTSGATGWCQSIETAISNGAASYKIGPNDVKRIFPMPCMISGGVELGEFKYLKAASPENPFNLEQYQSANSLMHLHDSTPVTSLTVHVPEEINPFVDETYPIVNYTPEPGEEDMISGILFEWVSAPAIQLTPNGIDGNARVPVWDGSAVVNTLFSSTLGLNLSTTGAGGLDTGSEAISTGYDIYLITEANGAAPALLAVISGNTPTLPAGYTHVSSVLWFIRNDSLGDISEFEPSGNGVCHYSNSDGFPPSWDLDPRGLMVLKDFVTSTADESGPLTPLDLSGFCPAGAQSVTLCLRAFNSSATLRSYVLSLDNVSDRSRYSLTLNDTVAPYISSDIIELPLTNPLGTAFYHHWYPSSPSAGEGSVVYLQSWKIQRN